LWPYGNFKVWTQLIEFSQKYLGFSKMDKNKCPKLKIRKYFWKKKLHKYNKLNNILKENLKKGTA
jgi:hypothetical protein